MKIFLTGLVLAATVAVAAGSAAAHNHLTVNTVGGTPGDQILIVAGYLGTEGGYTISGQRLLYNSLPAIYIVPSQLSQSGDLSGWYAGQNLVLTSDYYFATGNLSGGDFQWELSRVVPIGTKPAVAGWGDFNSSSVLVPEGLSNSLTRLARSYDTGIASHDHAQAYAFSGPGIYDVTLIAWDGNGVYADSSPVKVRFQIGSACPADFNDDGHVTVQDIFDFLSTWFSSSPSADFNGLGGVTVQDIFDFLSAWFKGCP